MKASSVKIKILLVEDDEALAKTLVDYFEANKFNVRWEVNGNEAMNSLKSFYPDVILCDLMMPVMDGETFFKLIKSHKSFKSIPFLIISANISIDVKLRQLKFGVNDFISKPFKFEELIFKINNIIDYKKNILSEKKQLEFEKLKINFKTFEKQIDDFLLKNISKKVSTEMLAKALNMSHSTLDKKIRKKFKVNISTYIREFRLEYSISLMKKGMDNIGEISFQSGFSSTSYFSVCFKNYTTHTPKQFIKKQLNFK